MSDLPCDLQLHLASGNWHPDWCRVTGNAREEEGLMGRKRKLLIASLAVGLPLLILTIALRHPT